MTIFNLLKELSYLQWLSNFYNIYVTVWLDVIRLSIFKGNYHAYIEEIVFNDCLG